MSALCFLNRAGTIMNMFSGKMDVNDSVATKFEGSHYETENDYTVLIYYRNPRERYDRVIGVQTINTLNRLTD